MFFDIFRKKVDLSTKPDQLLMNKPNFFSAEAYKLLRTNLNFTVPDNGKCRVIGISSSTRGEGKSTTAVNLSYVIAQTGKKVLLIDADLRLPSISKKLGIESSPGLSDALVIPDLPTDVIRPSGTENWDILCSGSIPPNPSEMLGSPQMKEYIAKLSEIYDFIIVDLPPITVVSDALAISPALHGIVLVVRSSYSRRRELHVTLKSLELAGSKVLGIVINAKKNSLSSGLKYSKYSRRGYYAKSYSGKDEKSE